MQSWSLLFALLGLAAVECTFPAASAWRVVNAQRLTDHWKIGELVLLDADGMSTESLIRNVIYSHHYDANNPSEPGHNLDCVHDGLWQTDGGNGVWAGGHGNELQACGSWLGYEFTSPVSIHGVRMSQATDGGGVSRVGAVSLEARVNSVWQHVTNVHFTTFCNVETSGDAAFRDEFVGSVDPPTGEQSRCEAVAVESSPTPTDEQSRCEAVAVESSPAPMAALLVAALLVLILGLVAARCLCRKKQPRPPVPPTAPTIQLQQVQQPAVAVAAQMPMLQPGLGAVGGPTMMVTCPPGIGPNQAFQVAGPGGQLMQVLVPAGVPAGGQFVVQMPAAPVAVVAVATPVAMAAPLVMATPMDKV